jgi:hypothetical protein
MNTIFAAADPDPKFLLQFILALSLLGNVASMIMSFVQRGRAQKRDVTIYSEAASQKDFDDHCKENTRMFEQIQQQASQRGRDLFNKIEENRKELSDEITCVKESVAGLEKQGEITNRLIASMDGKLDRLHEKKH